MLTKDQMSPQELETWKEANSFLFDHLKELQSSLDEQTAKCAKEILVCTEPVLNQMRLHCCALAGGASVLQELIDMEYSDIVEDEE